ncbi:MAG TPA: ATP synthase subunit I [Parvularculaceae bacterium]|nr:ATP synthase subunit I [Parvularculaceae bacterium]
MSAHLVLFVLLFSAAGAIVGAVHFLILSRSVSALAGGSASLLTLIGAPLLRAAATGGVLILAAMSGALPLLAALAGFLIARSAALRHVGGAL